MQQIYDKWLTQRDIHNRQTEGAMHSQPAPEEKNIVMPTDFAEPLVGVLLLLFEPAKISCTGTNQNLKCAVFLDYKGEADNCAFFFVL